MKRHKVTIASLTKQACSPHLVATVIALAAAMPTLAQDAKSKAEITELDTVVVESSKSSQTYIDSNSSIQVLSSQKLEESDVVDVPSLTKLVPGLVVEPRGNRTYGTTTLRGISSANYFSQSMSVYVDGVLQDSSFSMQELVNVKSVEVLKGPQGTLYGGNSHGGIINIVTYKGSDDPYAQIDLSADRLTKRSTALVSTPIGYGFSADLSLFTEHNQGTIRNTTTNTPNAEGSAQTAINFGLHYRPAPMPFSASLKIRVDDLDSNEELYLTEQEFDDKRTQSTNFFASTNPRLDRDLKALTFNGQYQVTDSLAVEAIFGNQRRKSDRSIVGGTYDEELDRYSQELRVRTTDNSGARFVLGLYHERSEWRYDSRISSPQMPGGLFKRHNTVGMDSVAVFGDVNVPLSPVLDVSAGLRYGVDKSSIDFLGGFPGADFVREREDNIFLPKLGLGLKLSKNMKVYGTASAGYKPSGYNFIPSGPAENAGYDAELSNNYELGLKSTGKALSFNAALYFIQLKKVQAYVGVMPNQILENLGNAESKGVELDATYAFTDDRANNVTIGLTWGKAAYTDGNEKGNLEGNRLQYSPETTVNLGLQAKIPQAKLPGKLLVGSNARYRSKYYFDEANILSDGDHTILDAHLKYVTPGGSSIRLFGKNLTDTKYASYKFPGFGPGAPTFGTWGRGMTIGIAGTAVL